MLAFAFAGIAFGAGAAARSNAPLWIVVAAATTIALWLATLAVRALR